MDNGLKYLVIHSTDTREGRDINLIGYIKFLYSDVINIDGNITSFLSDKKNNRTKEWNLRYNNKDIDPVSRHIAYVGGANAENTHAKDTRTEKQKETLEIYVKYMIKRHPELIVSGYNQLKGKSSPQFKVNKWLKKIGIDNKNIFGI